MDGVLVTAANMMCLPDFTESHQYEVDPCFGVFAAFPTPAILFVSGRLKLYLVDFIREAGTILPPFQEVIHIFCERYG